MESKDRIAGSIFLLAVTVSIFIGFNFFDINSSSFTSNVIKEGSVIEKKNCVEVSVPYESTENYNYYLKLQDGSAVNQEKFEFDRGFYRQAQIDIKNLDNEGGWVVVTINWETLDDKFTDKVRHYIEPDEIIEFNSEFDVDMGEDNKFNYNYKSEPIQKTRTVTKYKTETVCD